MSVTSDSERSDHEPTPAGLRSPLYGTATFTSLSPSTAPAPLSDLDASSTRLSYTLRSATPSNSDDGTRLRRVAISPTVSSYDSRRYTESESYTDDNSIDDTAEVEEALSRIEDETSQLSRDSWSSAHSSSGVSASSKSGTGSYATATTEPLNFERERRSLSTISERTESLSSAPGAGPGIFQNLFTSTFARPSSIFSAAARSLYGGPASPLTPPPGLYASPRPATPERTFKPAPPAGRRVGNLVASFESELSHSRPGSVPIVPRSPSPFSGSTHTTSPRSSHARAYTDGSYTHSRSYTDGGISLGGHSQSASFSSYLSPPPASSALSHTTQSGSSETERPHSPLNSVRNIVSAWKDRSPERVTMSASRSTASQSVVSGPIYTSGNTSLPGYGIWDGIFSLRRRGGRTATSGAQPSATSVPSYTDDFGSATGSVTDTRSVTRSGSVRSIGASSILDSSELSSFIRGSQDPLRIGHLWYLNVHAPPPFRWQRCRALLYPNTLLLTWIVPGGGRGVITLDLVHCNEVRSVPSPSHLSARDDIGTVAARIQMDEGGRDLGDYDLVEMLCPFQLLYSDGVERLGAESARERVRWVSAIWEALDRSVVPSDRSSTRSPTGSIRTIRSVTSSIISSESGSATTTYLPPSDTIPDIPDFDSTTFTRSLSPRNSFTASSLSSYGIARTRSSDDGALSGTDTFLQPLGGRSIEIAPSRSSSLRRTSSLADLDAEYASILRGTGISLESSEDTRTRSRGGSSRFSARWTREPSEHGAATSTISPSESASQSGVTRRVRASTFYTLSEPTFTQASTFTRGSLEGSSSDGTQIVASSLSLRGPASASLLGDSHSGPTSEETNPVRSSTSPSTPTRSISPETLYSSSGLSRSSAVRRRTPRTPRTRSGPATASTSDKENEYDEPSTLQESYTTTSYSEYTRSFSASRSTGTMSPLAPRPVISPPLLMRDTRRKLREGKPESESDEDSFHTPTASRTTTSYRSAPGTPTPSGRSLPRAEYDTAKAASTEYATAELCPSEPPSTEYTTAEVCPSTPPQTETEYFTAECRCKPKAPSLPEEISSLSPSLSLTSLSDEKIIDTEAASLYASSEVPTIPSVIEEANIPLPGSEMSETLSPEPSEVESTSIATPTIIPPTASSVPETPMGMTTVTPSSVSTGPPPSSPSSPSIGTDPSQYRSESSRTPRTKSLYVPSQSSPKSSPSITDGWESSFFAPSPSVQSIPMQDQPDISFETSFMRPGASELSEQPSPFMDKGLALSGLSSTVTPSSTTTQTMSDLSQTPTATRTYATPDPPTPSSVTTASSLTPTSERTPTISSLTPSTVLLAVPPDRSGARTPTPSSLTSSSSVPVSQSARSMTYTDVSSLTPSGTFEGDWSAGNTVTVSRTPSSVSSVSATSMRSSIFAPSVYEEALGSPATAPTLLTSRASTPRPITPRSVPLPSSPSLSIATATTSASISTPRSDAQTLTSIAPSTVIGAPREEILTHDVNRLLRYLHDLDQIRGGETQDMKDQLQRIEDELRGLADYLHKPEASMKDVSIGESIPIPGARSEAQPRTQTESLEYVSTPSQPPAVVQRPSEESGSTAPLPVPAPHEVQTPSVRSITPPQQEPSFTYSPSTFSEDMSLLASPHSDDFSLMTLPNYPTVPVSPPGSPSSPSDMGSGWPSSSTDAPGPPSSVTPSTVPRSSIAPRMEEVSDLTAESPFIGRTPVPVASPLGSLATTESALPMPPRSLTPSQEVPAVTPRAGPLYAGSPTSMSMPGSVSSLGSSVSSAAPPPSSSMPSSSSPSSIPRDVPPLPQIRQPLSPVVSMSDVELPSPGLHSAGLSVTATPEIPEFPSPPVRMPEPHIPMPEPPLLETVPPSPSVSIHTARPPSSARERAMDDLRDLLEDLRGQAQALWNGQLNTNRMLDNLRQQPAAPVADAEEVGNRLRNIEGLLDGILRDLERGLISPSEEPSEISSDTSSALRRYIHRLRDRRAEPPLMPTPVRPPPSNLDSEWLEFLSEPPPIVEQPIQGPPPLIPLYRRAPRRHREDSVSPPLSLENLTRSRSVPPEGRFPPAFLPGRRPRPPWMRRGASWERPRDSYTDVGQTVPEYSDWQPGPSRPAPVRHGRPQSGEDIDMLDRIHRLRRQKHGGDGRVDATRRPLEPSVFEEVPPPPRTQTAPPGGVPPGWYEGSSLEHGQPLPGAPAPAAFPPTAVPQFAPGMQQGPPIGIIGPPPPFHEMMDLLRQNRLAQTASIDQQREIMRYMRALNQWLEHDVRDRHNEMRSIGARVDDLRDLLRREFGRLGVPGGAPGVYPPMMPGQPQVPQGPQGQTFIVPPLPQPFVPGGGPMIPGMGMPAPGMPFTPVHPGSGPPVIPPFMDSRTEPSFIPPHPGGPQAPVIPPGTAFYPRPGEGMGPSSPSGSYSDVGPGVVPFIPPRPSPGMQPVPPPQAVHGQPITVMPPPVQVHSSHVRSETPSSQYSSPRSERQRLGDIHIHVPSPPPAQTPSHVPSQQPPPDVHRVGDEGRMPSGPLHPDLGDRFSPRPTLIPPPMSQPGQPGQPVVIMPPSGGPPMGYPMEPPPPQTVILPSHSPYSPTRSYDSSRPHVRIDRSRSHSPTQVIVQAPGSRRSRRGDSRESRRLHRQHRPRSSSRSESPPGRRRRYSDEDEGRHRSRTRSRSRTPPPIIIQHSGDPRDQSYQPQPQQPTVVVQQPSRRSSRSHSPGPGVIFQQPTGPPPMILPDPAIMHPSMQPTQQPPVIVQQPLAPQQPLQQPVMVVPPSEQYPHEHYPSEHYPPSHAPTHIPSMLPTAAPSQVPIVIHETPTGHGYEGPARTHPSPGPYSPRDEGHRLRRPSRSYSPERDGGRRHGRRPSRSDSREGDGGRRHGRRPSRSLSDSREGDGGRRHGRRPSRSLSDSRDRDGGRRHGRRPSRSLSDSRDRDGGRRHGRRPSRSLSDSREGDGGRRHGRRPSRSLSDSRDRDGGRRHGRRPSRSDSREGDGGRRHGRRPSRSLSDSRDHDGGRRHGRRPSRSDSRERDRPGRRRYEGDYRRDPYRRDPYRDRGERDPYRRGRSHSPSYYAEGGQGRPEYDRPSRSPSRVDYDAPRSPPTIIRRSPPRHHVSSRPQSPTRIVVETQPQRRPSIERITIPPTVPTYAEPGYAEPGLGPPTQVITVPTGRTPSRLDRPPTVIPVSGPPSRFEGDYHEEPVHESYEVPSEDAHLVRPPETPGTRLHSEIHHAVSDTAPIYPVAPPEPHRATTGIPSEPGYAHDQYEEGPPQVIRPHTPYDRRTPSGPGDLALHDALRGHQERLEEQERRLEELGLAAVEAEERREQYFREHEEERNRLFQENEERRMRETAELRDELEHTLQEVPRPTEAPLPVGQPPVSVGAPVVEETLPAGEDFTISEGASIAESVRPVPPPAPAVTAEAMPQLQEILALLRAQQAETVQCKAAEEERFEFLRDEIAEARADAKAECEERIRMLEDELARTKEELEHEKEQRRAEDLERIEREHAEAMERDEALRAQLGDITNLVQEQHEELARKREVMEERWQEKQMRREQKQGRNDNVYEMLERILQERDQERREREMERAAAAERPNIEQVLEELRRQNDATVQLINDLTEAWRADGAHRHQETIDAVRATAQEMVPYNLTGYLDEFSKALAGEIRTLLGEVGRLHEQKRTLQFEIGSLLHMYSQYGPGGQFEPDWRPTMGPLAPPQLPGGDMMPPGGGGPPPPPPGPEEPPPPARPAWRTVQQRAPRRRRTGRSEAPTQAPSMAAPTEPIQHPPSWNMWQPNPAFVPTPPPPGASPLVVPPPSGPTGLFGPRSPRGTLYAG